MFLSLDFQMSMEEKSFIAIMSTFFNSFTLQLATHLLPDKMYFGLSRVLNLNTCIFQ